ncbi:MAG: Rpn family recombination-promoting nuclease/putative transposase [Gemmatimonadetes bacterium]|nr:Rpn family recombination-promoting nuclease/putative transposase [Gemmatimonadota bacterium]
MDDAAFKKLFSDPRMIGFLIHRHLPEWADRVDYATLRPLPTELIDEQLRRRYPDTTWRVRTTDGATELLLLLEFQSRPERHMALRTTVYSCLAAQSLLQQDRELGRGDRALAVVALVLHHGDRRWNAAKSLSDLFKDSAPSAYRVVDRMPPTAQPTGPEDLPRLVLGLSGVTKAEQMRAALTVLLPLVETCEDEDFDRFMARSVKAMLRSKGISSQQLEEAMTMGTVVTEFQRSLNEIRQEGLEQGREQGIEQGQAAVLVQLIARKFGQGTAEEVRRLIEGRPGRDRIAQVAAAILDCDTPEGFEARVRES